MSAKDAWRRVESGRSARKHGENDAPLEAETATARESGGVAQPGVEDKESTTGTTPSGEPVGRVGGDETAGAGESGGDRRAGRPQDAHEGALRDE
jgi:hypothetical protein